MDSDLVSASLTLSKYGAVSADLNISFLFVIIVIVASIPIVSYMLSTNTSSPLPLITKKISLKIAGHSVEYEVIRNHQTLEISHKIYIEGGF